ncbi:hypothetical protein [Nostoc sp.]|uniref:hypothetical protein n=1 Tax=Nostoc sp. TaxID=1180 RepID=UPI002FFA976B
MFDNVCKFLAESFSADFATWLLGEPITQCAAEMIAAQKFNEINNIAIKTIYGSVSSGTAWRLLKLERQTLSIDLNDYTVLSVVILL